MASTAAPEALEGPLRAATSAGSAAALDRVLTEDDARAYRRFLEWSVGAGFKLGVVEVTEPWRRDALVAWTSASAPGTRVVRLDLASREPLRALLEQATAPPGEVSVLVLTHLEEASDRRRVCAQLNVQRDDLAHAFAVPWVVVVHPNAALDLQRYAPDFSDFAGLWLGGGVAEAAGGTWESMELRQTAAPSLLAHGALGLPGSELLGRADVAIRTGRLDEAEDLLAQHTLAHPEEVGSWWRAVIDGLFLRHLGKLAAARAKLEDALFACERDRDELGCAVALHGLGEVLEAQGRYSDAEALLRRSLAIFEKILGTDHPSYGVTLHTLANVLHAQCRYVETEALRRRVLAIYEKALETGHPSYHASLHALANVLSAEGRYEEAETLLRRVLAFKEDALGAEHPSCWTSAHALASVLNARGKYEEAETLLRRSRATQGRALAVDRPDRGLSLYTLAMVMEEQGKYEEAEALLRQYLAIQGRSLGVEHTSYGIALNDLAGVLAKQGNHEQAEALLRQSLAIQERALGADHPSYGFWLHNLGSLLLTQGKYVEAEAVLRQSLAIQERALGAHHPNLCTALITLAAVLANQHRIVEGELLVHRALHIAEQVHGSRHRSTAQALGVLAEFEFALGKPEAKRTAQRALDTLIATFGPDHPFTKQVAPTLDRIAADTTAARVHAAVEQARSGDPEGAIRELEAIADEASAADTPGVEVSARIALADILTNTHQPFLAGVQLRAALAIAERIGDETAVARIRAALQTLDSAA